MYKCTVWQSYLVDSNGSVYKINEPSISCLEMPKSDSETTESVLSVLPSSYIPIPVSETKLRKDAILREKMNNRPQKATSTLVGADMLVTKMLHAIQKSTAKPFPHPSPDPTLHVPIEQKSSFVSPFKPVPVENKPVPAENKPVPAEKNAPSKLPCKSCSCKFDTAAQLSEHIKICNSAHICE